MTIRLDDDDEAPRKEEPTSALLDKALFEAPLPQAPAKLPV